MDAFKVVGGARLAGDVRVPGAKSSVLTMMAAALLAEGTTTLSDVPDIADVQVMAEQLSSLGCTVEFEAGHGELAVRVPAKLTPAADQPLAPQARSAIGLLGPLLARTGAVEASLPPGGPNLDSHLEGLRALGATIAVQQGRLVATAASGLAGARIRLGFPGVGATENLLLAAVLARGTSVLENVARDPEVVDLCRLLRRMGARIDGLATSTLEIEGVAGLTPTEHRVVPDRIVAGTWAFAAAITGGDLVVHNGEPGHLKLVLEKLTDAGAQVFALADGFRVVGPERPRAVDVSTLPYPGFPPDLQPFMMVLAARCDGTSMITENLFEAREGFVDQLARLGAQVRLDGRHALVRGVAQLRGAAVQARGLRRGAALVLAALAADGDSLVGGAGQVDRGYDRFDHTLRGLGAQVSRAAG